MYRLNNLRFYRNFAEIKKYTDGYYRLVIYKTDKVFEFPDREKQEENVNDEKLENNISRARATIFELAMCNDWQYFVTLTLSPKKYDRYNLEKFRKDLSKFINNYNTHCRLNIKYMFVPEQHQDGAWHMHGFIKGLTDKEFEPFKIKFGQKLPQYIVDRIAEGREICNWIQFADKFGYTVLEAVRSKEAASMYVMKYISKNLAKSIKELGAHLYYCSKGLKRAEFVIREERIRDAFFPDYENEFLAVKRFRSLEEALQVFDLTAYNGDISALKRDLMFMRLATAEV